MQLTFQLRADTKPFLEAALSEESKTKRRRTKTINLQMTAISWALEFITGILAIALMYFSFANEFAIVFLSLTDVCMNFVVIPSSYIFNTEEVKQYIIAEGWRKWFNKSFRSNRVTPPTNDGLAEAPIELMPIPRPIPTISGNIFALSR